MKSSIVPVLMAAILPLAGIAATESEFTVSLWAKLAQFPDPNGDSKKGETVYGLFSDNWDVRMMIGADRKLSAQVTIKGDKSKGEKDIYYTVSKPLGQNLRTNEWNHYAVTWSVKCGEMTLFLNGAAVDRRVKDGTSKVGITPVDCNLDKIRVGSLAGGWAPVKGEIRGFRMVREALTADGIAAAEAEAARAVAAEFGVTKGVSLAELASARQKARARAADAKLGRGRPLYWGVVDPMGVETYLPDSDLPADSLFKPLLVCAAKDEYEAASLVLRPLKDLKSVVPVVSELRTKDGAALPPSIIDSRIVKVAVMSGGGAKNRHIRVRKPVYLLHDDALLKCDFEKMESYIRLDRPEGAKYEWITKQGDSHYFEQYKSVADWPIHDAKTIQPLDLRQGFGQQFWFTFHVPRNAKSGLYLGEVDFRSAGKSVAKVPVKLRVLPFALPEPRTSYDLSRKMYPGVYWRSSEINFDNPSKPGSITSRGRTAEQVRAELRNMKAHGILYPTVAMAIPFPGWDWKVYGKPEHGGSERKFTEADRLYFRRVIDLLKEEGFPMDKLFFHTGGNWGFRTFYDPAKHRDVLKRSVEATLALVREAVGYDTDVQFYGVDEAHGDALKAEYAVWKDIHEFGAKVFTTCVRSHTQDVVGHIDTQIASQVPDRRFSKMQHDAGGLIWNYANPQAGAKDQARPYRNNFGFGVYGENYDGFATYAWNVSAEHPWNDFDNRIEPDLAFVVPTADGVVDTPSWEGYREGVDDIRYATLLRHLCRKRPGPKADEATKFLDSINAYKLDFDCGYTRLKIIDYILDLMPGQKQ